MSEMKNVPDGWKSTTLGEIAKVQTGPFGSQLKNDQYITGGTPVITVEHIVDFRIKDFDYPSVTDEDKQRLSKYLLKTGDIVFTRVGSVDLSAYVNEKQNGWMFSSRMLSVRSYGKVNSRFLSYYFRQKSYRNYILKIAVGATMPSINTGILKELPVAFPQLTEQKSIADILSAFDNKIELLQSQNKTLEETAQTIYAEWFGKYSIDNELPNSWRVGKLGDIIEIKYGKDHKHLKDGNFPLYGSGGIMRFVEKPLYEKESILIPRKGTLSNLFYLSQPFWSVDTMFYSKIFKSHFGRFTFLFLKTIDLSAMNVGSAVPSLTTQVLNQIPIIIPTDEIVMKFNNVVNTFYQKLESNNLQIQTLTKTRDELLPRLMSGALRVKM